MSPFHLPTHKPHAQTANIRFVFDDEAMELRRRQGAADLRGKVDKEVRHASAQQKRTDRAQRAPTFRGGTRSGRVLLRYTFAGLAGSRRLAQD